MHLASALALGSDTTLVGWDGVTSTEAGRLREQLERIDAPALGLDLPPRGRSVANFIRGGEEKGYGYY